MPQIDLDTSWAILNDNELNTEWEIRDTWYTTTLTTSWSILQSIITQDISWKILNDVNLYVHYGTELDSPLRKITVKNIEFLYNANTISFDRTSKNIEFIKNLM